MDKPQGKEPRRQGFYGVERLEEEKGKVSNPHFFDTGPSGSQWAVANELAADILGLLGVSTGKTEESRGLVLQGSFNQTSGQDQGQSSTKGLPRSITEGSTWTRPHERTFPRREQKTGFTNFTSTASGRDSFFAARFGPSRYQFDGPLDRESVQKPKNAASAQDLQPGQSRQTFREQPFRSVSSPQIPVPECLQKHFSGVPFILAGPHNVHKSSGEDISPVTPTSPFETSSEFGVQGQDAPEDRPTSKKGKGSFSSAVKGFLRPSRKTSGEAAAEGLEPSKNSTTWSSLKSKKSSKKSLRALAAEQKPLISPPLPVQIPADHGLTGPFSFVQPDKTKGNSSQSAIPFRPGQFIETSSRFGLKGIVRRTPPSSPPRLHICRESCCHKHNLLPPGRARNPIPHFDLNSGELGGPHYHIATSTPSPSPSFPPRSTSEIAVPEGSLSPASPVPSTTTPVKIVQGIKPTMMNPPRTSRYLDPALAAISKHKAEAIRLAKEQGSAVKEMCRRAKTETPPYEFEELIGKGAYGRVYKGHQLPSNKLVAIKVMDIDSLDYQSLRDFKDESIKDFIHETNVMKQVKDAGAKNINELIEAISIHSQLWLVCEYCPGGSVRTLMRATSDRLDEKFIIPIARELAEGLRAIHAAGIIHRDIKAANVLIHEEGRLQICDFGVAGVLQSQLDKRSTWIGTPHWMPPEMFATRAQAHQYGSEIDVWAYGCTLYEFATGNPPNSNLRERMQIGRQLNRSTPKLTEDKYSEGLRDLVAFALNSDPATRPTMGDILSHAYIADSSEEYPTSSLSELVRIYYQWSQRGGQRISLFNPGGAAAAEFPGAYDTEASDWNFSTTDGFERRFSVIDLDELAASVAEFEEELSPTTTAQPARGESFDESPSSEMTEEQRANFDERVRRGAAAMEGIFNEERPTYKYETKNDFVPVEQKQPPFSDLPLRAETDRSSVTSQLIDIDIGSFDMEHYAAGSASAQPFQLADADTIRANRSSGRLQHRNSNEGRSSSVSSETSSRDASQEYVYQPQMGPRPPTMDWKFPSFEPPREEEEERQQQQQAEPQDPPVVENNKRDTMGWTFPVMTPLEERPEPVLHSNNDTLRAPLTAMQQPTSSSSTLRPRDSIGEPGDSSIIVDDEQQQPEDTTSRPSTAASNVSDYDPFRFDRPQTPPGGASTYHSQFLENDFPSEMMVDVEKSSPVVMDGPGPDEEEEEEGSSSSSRSPGWHDASQSQSHSHEEPFPTAIPFIKEMKDLNLSDEGTTTVRSAVPEPLATTRRSPAEEIPIYFPDLRAPSLESMTGGADEGAITAELDRLLGDFLDALGATGEALSRVSGGGMASTPDRGE